MGIEKKYVCERSDTQMECNYVINVDTKEVSPFIEISNLKGTYSIYLTNEDLIHLIEDLRIIKWKIDIFEKTLNKEVSNG